jgi:uncharacterized protein (TIGR00730 family)
VCVFCGSRDGRSPAYLRAAREVGEALGRRGWGLVYGGASVGLMGAVADAALASGAPVVGVIPQSLADREIAHRGLTELVVVDGMHARKAEMAARCDAFLALPGGLGTFEELFEVLTWSLLGLHRKPVGLLDVEGYFSPLLAMVEHGAREGFIRPEHAALLHHATGVDAVLDLLAG